MREIDDDFKAQRDKPGLYKDCGNCKHRATMMNGAPCKDCVKPVRKPEDTSLTKWEPASASS